MRPVPTASLCLRAALGAIAVATVALGPPASAGAEVLSADRIIADVDAVAGVVSDFDRG